MYFNNAFPPEFGVTPNPALINKPELLLTPEERAGMSEQTFILETAAKMVHRLNLAAKDS